MWLGGTSWSPSAIQQVMLPELARLATAERGRESELRVRKVSVDLAGTRLTDEALTTFLAGWPCLGLSHCSICFKLQRNLLTDQSLSVLGHFAVADSTGVVEELHATHQLGPGLRREAVLGFLVKLSSCRKYPLWVKRRRCFRPVHLRLGQCGVEDPEAIAEELESRTGAKVCFADDQGCVRMSCVSARSGGACPVAHLYDFRSQEQPTELAEPSERLTSARERERGKTFLCGSCQKALPIDMFTRSQFQKASALDDGRAESESHLVRRCNECVTQPCCACGALLPLTAFANSQMLRPQGSRRCRSCAAETWWCVRCARPRAQAEFSSFEARKGKRIAKVCKDCNKSNTYFDRRHALCVAFSGKYAAAPSRLPSFSREVLSNILAFAKESQFVSIFMTSFTCTLCNKTFSFLANGGDGAPVERHLRTSQQHAKRLRSLEAGKLVELSATGLDPERFAHLGLSGAFCSSEQVKEAGNLVDVWALRVQEPELDPSLFNARKQRTGEELDARGPRWASPEQVERARFILQLRSQRHVPGSATQGDPELASFFASAGGEDVARGSQRAQHEKLHKLQMLCSSGGSEEEEDPETQALLAFLSS
ncbi:unnamed protein product [Symbiodinium natans]|uniref:Stc1 domain-containing protein n=1 Tax=Symbiodinium natans TaxID=878477 RepID=A0A812TZB3_9DINO|nr:unnamed protein product [Symbiodinium natans]